MEGKHAKRLLVSSSLSLPTAVFASAEERRRTATILPPSAGSSVANLQPLCFSHYGVSSSHIILSPAGGSDHLAFVSESHPKLTAPKIEPIESKAPDSISIRSGDGSRSFNHLPMLRSLESTPLPTKMLPVPPGIPSLDLISIVESSHKRFRASSAFSSSWCPPPRAPPPSPPRQRSLPSSELSRLRRKKISDRTRIIESLMPWERRMNTGTMLEEAYKYVRFLEAQVAALQTMPIVAAFSAAPVSSGRGGALGGLEQLNRQQMLQVVVNSPRVQEKLYARGLCVFSVEQVAAFRRAVGHCPPFVSAPVIASE